MNINDEYKRIQILERIIKVEKTGSVKMMLALIGLKQFAEHKVVRWLGC